MDEEKLLEMFQRLFEKMGASVDNWSEELDKSTKGQTKQEKLIDRITKQFTKLNSDLEKGRKKIIDLGPTIKDLDQQIEDLDEGVKKSELEIERQRLANQFLTAQYKKAAVQLTSAIGDTLVKGIFKGTKTLVNDLQSNSSGIALAGDLMTQAIDSSQAGMTAVGKTGEALGSGMAQLGGKTGKFGIALSAGSAALEYFTAGVAEAAKAGIDMLVKEVEKTVKAFNDTTASGALFAHGMDDLRANASRAGLTVEQFGAVIKNNNAALAESGMTVETAARAVADVTSRYAVQTGKSGLTLQREMQNLGIGFQEQAEITAQVIASYKKTGAQATNSQVAAATVEMAKNMKAMSDIMGEEYKARQDAAKKQAEQYAFQAKVNEIARKTNDPGLVNRVNQALGAMSESNRRAAIQATVLGGAVTDVAANLTGAAAAGQDFGNALLSGRTDIKSLTDGTAKLNDSFQAGTSEMGAAISRATIATGDLADVSQAYDQQQQDSFKMNTKNRDKALSDADKLSAAHGGLQEEVMGAEKSAQDLKMALQKELTPAIKSFASVANQILDGVKKTLAKAGIGNPGETGRDWTKIAEGAGLAIAGVVGGIATSWTGVGGVAGGIAAEQGASMMMSGWNDPVVKKADGGIADGPVSGYAAQLHGTEAVVPLPDGKNIPVEVKQNTMGGIDPKMMSDMLHELKKGHEMTKHSMDELVRHARTTAGYSSQLVQLAS